MTNPPLAGYSFTEAIIQEGNMGLSCWRDFTGFIAHVYELSDAKLTLHRQYQTQLPIAGLPQGIYSYVCMHVHPLVATADLF